MTADDLRAWQAHQGLSLTTASAALGMHRSSYARMLSGDSDIDRRTALACAAIAAGIAEWRPQETAETAETAQATEALTRG